MIRYYFLLAILLSTQCQPVDSPLTGSNKFDDPRFTRLYDFQDRRDTQSLIPYLSDEDALLRRAAAIALGSVQDPQASPYLESLLLDPVASVRSAAAYAIGQLYDTALQTVLIRSIKQERETEVTNRLLEALGKSCSPDLGFTLLSEWHTKDPENSPGVAWGLYRAGLKGMQSPACLERIIELLQSENNQARLGAAHYLARTQGLKLEQYSKELIPLLTDEDPQVRMALALALGKCAPAGEEALIELVEQDPDYRVRINALRALGNFSAELSLDKILSAVGDTQPAVALTAAQYLKEFGTEMMADTLKSMALATDQPWVSSALLAASLKHGTAKNQVITLLQERFLQSENPYHQAHYLQALSEDIHGYAFFKEVLYGEYPKVVTTQAIEGLFTINRHPEFDTAWKEEFASTYEKAIRSGDVAVAGIAAQALRQPQLKFKESFEDTGFLDEAIKGLVLPRDIETYLELQRTKNFLSKNPQAITLDNPYNNPIDWEQVVDIPKGHLITVNTSQGKIQMELLVEQSPATVGYIYSLMKKGFYNGKAFHRVVPNFVAQGGCPRGDGWGSTELSLRSELGPLKYQTGSVGVASAGKDTESCQWFITHSPTPHLDGRYTIFAKVVNGMDVVHQLQPGDKIETVELDDTHEI